MGLRINTNVSAITALRTLKIGDRNQARSLERLSTGLRINRAADDPSGLIISEILRSQLGALNQASDNSQNAQNMVSVADSALQKVSDILVGINESIIFALNTGGASPDQIAAEQEGVDNALAAIDRIAGTTRYGDRDLLNGSAEYQLVSNRPPEIQNLTFRSIQFNSAEASRSFTVEIANVPERAEVQIANANTTSGATLRITGERGTTDVGLASGVGASGIARAVNSVAAFTGVFASGGATSVGLYSESFGVEGTVRVEVVNGTVSGTGSVLQDSGVYTVEPGALSAQGNVMYDQGQEGSVMLDGSRYEGTGLDFKILSRVPIMEFSLNPDEIGANGISAGAQYSFTVANTGLLFQLNELPRPTDGLHVGIQSVLTSELGLETFRDTIEEATSNTLSPNLIANNIMKGGSLSTLKTGGGNSLSQDPTNAHHIISAAQQEVSHLRAYLGSVVADSIEPNIDALAVSIENLSASLSDLRDLDFAEETSNFVKNQILFQSGIGALASANQVPQSVLTLLGV